MFKKIACLATGLLLILLSWSQAVESISGPQISIGYQPAEYLFDAADTIKYTTPLSFCEGGSVVLTANNAPDGASFQWKKDGSNISGAISETYTATTSGNYSVLVNAASYDTVTVTVYNNPNSNFNFVPNSQCANTPVSFTSLASGSGLTYSWNFDDPNSGSANTSTGKNPLHEFIGTNGNLTQSFNVKLTVTSSFGCATTTTKVVTVKQLPNTKLGGPGAGIYDGKPYFKKCSNVSSAQFDFTNQSSTVSTNNFYRIIWGDNTPDFTSASYSSTSHVYSVGTYTLTYIVTGQNGCSDTATYYVFLGTNPAVGLGNPGNTTICTGESLTFPISSTESNPPGTEYTITFNDGTPALVYQHPVPSSVTHTFNLSSCGTTSGAYTNSFSASIQASNPCQSSSATVVPIYVSQRANASFSISPNDTVCISTAVTLTNTSGSNNYIDNGNCMEGKGIWKISPSTGWNITSGSLGDDFGLTDASAWMVGSGTLIVNFSTPGVYTIKLKTGNPNCGNDEVIKTICVNPKPVSSFSLDKDQGCAPLTVKATNNSNSPFCGENIYQWSLSYSNAVGCTPNISSYSFINGTSASSEDPEIKFNNAGIYTLSLTTKSPGGVCSSIIFSKTITVKSKPIVSFTVPATVCQNGSITPNASVNSCFGTDPAVFAWSFPGATPSGSSSSSPGSISFNSTGTQTLSLSVSNECGTTSSSQTILVKPSPGATVPANRTVCAGEVVNNLSVTSTLPGTNFSWTNTTTSIGLAASGNGPIPSFNSVNNTSSPVTATITVSPTNNGCTGPSQSFTITVNPKPAAPVVSSPINYCQHATAAALTATASSGHHLLWYATSSGGTGSTTAPVPSTASAGSASYYVSQVNTTTGCEGPRASITVSVKPTPQIAGGTSINPTTCNSSTGSISVTGLSANTSYSVSYTKNGTAQTITLSSNASGLIKITGLSSGSYTDISVTKDGCTSNTIGPFSLSDPNPPATPVASGSGTYCSGSSIQLNASSTTGSVGYAWSGPNGFSSNLQNPVISNAGVNASGTYHVIATLNGCSSSAGSVTVTVNATPNAPSLTSNAPICSGNTLNLSASTNMANVGYSWTGPNGFTSSLQNPSIANATAAVSGAYIVTATSVTGSCLSSPSTINVTVKPTPQITNAVVANPSNCASSTGSITLSGLTANTTYTVNYQKNGSPVTAAITSTASGSLTIGNLSSGTYTSISLSLNGCSSNTVGPFTLTDPDPPAVPLVESNGPVCTGASLNLMASTTSGGSAGYSWTGPDGFTSNQQNPVLNNVTTAQSGTYTVVLTINGCSSSSSVNATIHPKPSKPSVLRPVVYCENDNAVALTATASGSNVLTWFDNQSLSNGSSNPLVPSTAAAGDYYFYVIQTNGFGCNSDTSRIPVKVYPSITGNVIGNDQAICSGNIPATIIPSSALSGGTGSYQYQWQFSTDNGTSWTNISGATTANYSPGALFVPTRFRRLVHSGPCTDHISNEVLIDVNGTLAAYEIGSAQTICAGAIPVLLNGQAPTGGNGTYTYQWQSSTDQINWTDIAGTNTQDFQPAALNNTTHYRRKVISGPCSVFSSVVTITVNPVPVLNSIADQIYCSNVSTLPVNFSTNVTNNISYSWTNNNPSTGLATSGSGNIPSFTTINNEDPKVPVISNITVIPVYTSNSVACAGNPGAFTVTVLPFIAISPVDDMVVCTGTNIPSFTPSHNAAPFNGSTVSFKWTVTGSGTTLASGSGSVIPSFNTLNTGNTDLVTTISITPVYSFGGKNCDGSIEEYAVTVKPATPGAGAGADAILCAATSYTMSAVAIPGTTGLWTQVSGNLVVITDPASSTTTVTGLQEGETYGFEWMITGFASCPPTKDTVTIKVEPQLVNTIDTGEQTICYGQPVTINGFVPSGGNGTYQYQWQSSTDGINWNDLPGFTSAGITYTPTQTIYLRRRVTSLPCQNESMAVHVIVQPPVSNNNISADQSICINTAASLVVGSSPSGANGSFQYQWQQSVDNGNTWTDIAGATSRDHDPGILVLTTSYRRNVFSNLCTGPQSSMSNVVTITVNPDARSVFTATKDSSCAPFLIDPAVILLQQFPDRNSSYQWYADGSFIGQGTSFPGYTLNNSRDSVKIKLVAISSFGCLNDSTELTFYTFEEPLPSFTLSDTMGCGPLTIHINNTTPHAGLFQYHWNFGNGETSLLQQPAPVTFASNPTFGDTTYVITLTVTSQCNTYIIRDSVSVKSKPKALFSPDHSVGCSPMTVVFNNNSAGRGNSYTWYFDDGSIPVTTSEAIPVSHTFHTGVQDTFHVKLVALNECGSDTLTYAIVVSPNQVQLDFAINGNQFSGCSPHVVQFINNSSGASHFAWNFGDNNITNTTDNIDTVSHTYLLPGTYTITLTASNGCSDTTTTETIIVYPKPEAGFTPDAFTACIGDTIRFTNHTSGANSYLWIFGDGATSSLNDPSHHFTAAGIYTVKLVAYNFNAPGTVCTDTVEQQIQIATHLPGAFDVSASVGYCAPFTVQFSNLHIPSVQTSWDFGDGSTATGDHVSHTFMAAGSYLVTLVVTVPGGCTYTATKNIQVLGPSGTWTHHTGYSCPEQNALFQVNINNTDSLTYHFGDGHTLVTTDNVVYHHYENPGLYFPRVFLNNTAGCAIELPGIDTIRVDKISAGFTYSRQNNCGYTTVNFTDTSFAFFGKDQVQWNFGDGTIATGGQVTHQYGTSGNYIVQLIVTGNSGCTDTVAVTLNIHVNNVPVAEISAVQETCQGYKVQFNSNIQSSDAIDVLQWSISNGVTNTNSNFTYTFSQTGTYTIRLITGTINGCFDTAYHSLEVKPSPTIMAVNDIILCRGSSAPLTASGVNVIQYNWMPLQGLSCYDCQSPVASPVQTTPYIIQGTNNVGCSAYDTVIVTVIQPLHISVSADDSICTGSSTHLLASGATTYSWSPSADLNNTAISNPTASPAVTTTYRVVGYDGYNCFTDTAFVTVAVGEYPIVGLGPDLTLATGTLHPLASTIQNGPVSIWQWSPSTDLSCNNCPLPIANIKKDIGYSVMVTTPYGCSARDSINIRTFCEEAQVFIPNAFTPNGDGYNDILMVRASGVAMVRSFRIFNRWGELVFERSNAIPNDPQYGWDGKIKGIIGGPDVYVYTAEVVCENGSTYTYKGNVTILK